MVEERERAQQGWPGPPDPTALTQAALERERENYRRELNTLREILDGRIDLVIQSLADHRINADARFQATQRETALALTSQREAVDKQERAVERTIEALQSSLRSELFVVKEGIDANSARLERSEGQRLGASQLWALILGIITLVALLGGLFATMLRPEPVSVPVPAPPANTAPAALVQRGCDSATQLPAHSPQHQQTGCQGDPVDQAHGLRIVLSDS